MNRTGMMLFAIETDEGVFAIEVKNSRVRSAACRIE